MKKFVSSLIAFGLILSLSAQTVSAVAVEGEFEGDPETSKLEAIMNANPVMVHEDFSIDLRTRVDGADLQASIDVMSQGRALAMQITTAAGANIIKISSLGIDVARPGYSTTMLNDSTLRVNIDADDDDQLDINTIAFPPGDYEVDFGSFNNDTNTISVFADTSFTVKANGGVDFMPSGLDFSGVDFSDWVIADFNNVDFGDLFDQVDDGGQFVILPDKIVLSPSSVKPGKKVRVSLYKDIVDASDLRLSLPAGWDIQVWTTPSIVAAIENKLLSFAAENFTTINLANSDADSYDFTAPDGEKTYAVKLIDADGAVVSKANFVVDAEAESPWDNVFVLPDFNLDDLVIDIPDVIGDDDDSIELLPTCDDLGQDDWEYEMVNTLVSMTLYPIETNQVGIECRTHETVNRKEFTAWLLQAYHPEEVENIAEIDLAEMPFNDVDLDDPYAPYILRAYELGIINGHPDGSFKPNVGINRAEVLKVLLRASGIFEDSGDEVETLYQNYEDKDPSRKFGDVKGSDWFYRYLWYAVSHEIIQGYPDNTAKMGRTVLYGEAAKMLYLSLELEGRIQN